jgi:hypothetical protein
MLPEDFELDERSLPTKVQVDQDLADRLRDAQHAYDEVKEYLDALKDEIKHRYADYANVIAMVGREKIFTCVRRESMRLDRHQLKRDWPDIYAQYAKPYVTQYLTVARPKADS